MTTWKPIAIVLAAAVAVTAVVVLIGGMLTSPQTTAGADPDDAQQVARGEIVYAENCASCHGRQLEGEANWRSARADGTFPAPPHDETGHTWHHPDDLLFQITKEGGRAFNPKSNMPGFGGSLSDADIWAVLAYIKSQWPGPVQERQRQITQAND